MNLVPQPPCGTEDCQMPKREHIRAVRHAIDPAESLLDIFTAVGDELAAVRPTCRTRHRQLRSARLQ
jgi:hypothetical protein